MTQEQLNRFKQGAKEFYLALEPLFQNVWNDDNKTTLLRVLLQNIQFISTNVSDYSFEGDLKKTKDTIEAIDSIAGYENYHIYNYVSSELDMIWTGIIMEDDELWKY